MSCNKENKQSNLQRYIIHFSLVFSACSRGFSLTACYRHFSFYVVQELLGSWLFILTRCFGEVLVLFMAGLKPTVPIGELVQNALSEHLRNEGPLSST